jgi:hypothetical protein
LNVPAMRPQTDNTWQKIWWAILDSRTKIKWMMFTILVPEYIVGKALNELVANNDSRWGDWDKVTTYMANMGYFIIDFGDYWLETSSSDSVRFVEEENVPWGPTKLTKPATPSYSLQKVIQESLEKPYLSASTRLNMSRLSHPYWALSAEQLRLLTPDLLDPPDVPIRQLEVLDRSDALVKALALVQLSYLIIQLVARKIGGLPSAQLEIATLAFSASSFITYILYWNRPQGVDSVHVLKPKCAPSTETIDRVAAHGPAYFWTKLRHEYVFEKTFDFEPIPNDGLIVVGGIRTFGNNDELFVLAGGAFLGGTIFGAIHCLAWDFPFPTHGEAIAWRACSVVTTSLPLLSAFPLSLWMYWHPWNEQPEKSPGVRLALGLTLILGFLVPYVLARLFLIVEMFRSLFFLPPEAFVDTWSGSFPHLG